MNIADIRKDYTLKTLDLSEVSANPVSQFECWLSEALEAQVCEPTALNLATVSAEGKPSARIMLLKGVENGAFVFYSNYQSRKAGELAANPYACLTFHWAELERQVRIEGETAKIAAEASDAYYQTRPMESQIGAHASPQSEVIPSRQWLQQRFEDTKQKYTKTPLKRPKHWGGYALHPNRIEFWQGRAGRLHDRILYTKTKENWEIKRLAP